MNDIRMPNDIYLTPKDINHIRDLTNALNSDAAQNISVYAELGRCPELGYKKCIRVQTAPTPPDMVLIKSLRPEANRRDYKRRSHWVKLYDLEVFDKLSDFIKRQKRYIYHCTQDANHRAKPFDTPAWKPDTDNSKYAPRHYLGDRLSNV